MIQEQLNSLRKVRTGVLTFPIEYCIREAGLIFAKSDINFQFFETYINSFRKPIKLIKLQTEFRSDVSAALYCSCYSCYSSESSFEFVLLFQRHEKENIMSVQQKGVSRNALQPSQKLCDFSRKTSHVHVTILSWLSIFSSGM